MNTKEGTLCTQDRAQLGAVKSDRIDNPTSFQDIPPRLLTSGILLDHYTQVPRLTLGVVILR